MGQKHYEKGAVLSATDEPTIFLLNSGEVMTTSSKGLVNQMTVGDHFGSDDWGVGDELQKCTAIATTPVDVSFLRRSDVHAILLDCDRLGKPIPPRTRVLSTSVQFKNLSKIKL